jgi:hypothetical protein
LVAVIQHCLLSCLYCILELGHIAPWVPGRHS